MAASVSDYDSVLVRLYPAKALVKLAEISDPMLGVIEMRSDFTGSERRVVINSGNNQSVGVTFASVQAIAHSDKYNHFDVTRGKFYGFAQYERELFEALQGNGVAPNAKANFVSGLKAETDGVMTTLQNELGRQIHSHHGGAICRLTSSTALTTALVVTDAKQLLHIKKGMRLEFASTDGRSGSVRSGYVTVDYVDFSTATIYLTSSATAAVTGIAVSDYVFRAYTFGVCMYGWDDWIGTAPTTGDSHFGVDRTGNPDVLSGLRITASAATIEDSLQDCIATASWRGADTLTHGFVHPEKWRELAKEFGTRARRDDPVKSKRAGVGYSALYVLGQKGQEIPILASPNVPTTKCRLIDASDWTLDTLGGAPRLITDTNGKILRTRDAADSIEARAGWLGQLHCRCPNHQVDLTLPS